MKRKTTQHLAPIHAETTPPGQYNIYPGFAMGDGKIKVSYAQLAKQFTDTQTVILDGYLGVFWDEFRAGLDEAFSDLGLSVAWTAVSTALLSPDQIDHLIEPFLGGDDPIFGTRFTCVLPDFFDADKLAQLKPNPAADLNVIYGCGAALAGWTGTLAYIDIPKNEIQFRARASRVTNLGAAAPFAPKPMYKRMYFVDWIALNAHKAQLLPNIDIFIDGQRDEPVFSTGDHVRDALTQMSQNYFRVRPWFEPGPWGGQWIKERLPQLAQEVPNYAWSFELIVPENGLMMASDGNLLELSFDCLMYQDNRAILGECADQFNYEFPIRFDFLDTFDGGNLSVQVHPRPEFIREQFGETFTQDETYYILDCGDEAEVYLGFQDDIDPDAFRAALETSFREAKKLDVERFVNKEKAEKHGLYLIPNGTIHCSGKDALVLEISATPYIFTFKMYDWLRLDLDGQPRPMNFDRAFANLYFDRKGERMAQEFVSHPYPLAADAGWQLDHVPTHAEHFYDVHRLMLNGRSQATLTTDNSPHILSLVEGQTVILQTKNGLSHTFNYAETFVVPAAAEQYTLTNPHDEPIMVVKAFMKAGYEYR